MPYDSIDAAKNAEFPTSAEDINLTLAQINKLAAIYDAVKKAGTADNPMAVAWAQWKDLYKKQGGRWVEQAGTAQNIPEGMEAATLSFGSLSKITEDQNGDTIFHDVTLLAEGTWTDGHSRTATHYGGAELEKMRFEKSTMKMDHDIFDWAPITNEIGIIENTRFEKSPIAKWLGDVRIFPTQNGRDTALLLKRGKITDISSELFLKPIAHTMKGNNGKDTTVSLATDMVFMGAATVRQGACTICKFNEGIDTMTEETNPAGGGEGTEGAGAAELNEAPDIVALKAQIKELEQSNAVQAAAERDLAKGKIVELEATVNVLRDQITAMDHDHKVRELQKKYEALSSQPVIHTVVSGAQASAQAVELDSGEFEAFSASDFTED